MKKVFRRIFSLVLALAMTFMSEAAVFAAYGTTTPSDTDARVAIVYNVEKGVTVRAYQILDATYDSKGNGLTGYTTAAYTDSDGNTQNFEIEDFVDITASEVNAIASDIYNGTITPTSSKTLTYAAVGTTITNTLLGEETSAESVTLTAETGEAYYAALEAGMWLILVSDSNATIYNPMIVSNWYEDANDAASLQPGSVDADGYFHEDIYDYTTADDGTVTYTDGSMTAVYAKSDVISIDKDIVNYSGAGDDVTYETDSTTAAYDSSLMTYDYIDGKYSKGSSEEEASGYDQTETNTKYGYEGSESSHSAASDSSATEGTEGADYDIGDTVQFEIKTTIPDYADTYFDTEIKSNTSRNVSFLVIDDLSAGLDAVNASDISVLVGGTAYDAASDHYTIALFNRYLGYDSEGNITYYYQATSLAGGTAISGKSITAGYVYTIGDDGIPVFYGNKLSSAGSVTQIGRRIMIDFSESFIKAHGNQGVIIYYAATLNSDAEIVGDINADSNPNEVNLVFSNNPTTILNTGTIGKGDQVYVYTFSITDEIVKVFNDTDDAADDDDDAELSDGEQTVEDVNGKDADNQDPDDDQTTTVYGRATSDGNTVNVVNALAGAKFTIYSDADCTIPYVNLYAVENGDYVQDDDGKYVYTVTSDANGYVSFYGLSEGTYYITETEAPDGYTINDTVYKIVISCTYDTDGYSGSEDDIRDDGTGLLTGYTITVTNLAENTSASSTYTITNAVDDTKSYTFTGTSGEGDDAVITEITCYWSEFDPIDETSVTGTGFAYTMDNNDTSDNDNGAVSKESTGAVSVSVTASETPTAILDTAWVKLPSTGGIGLYIIIIASAAVFGIAAAASGRKKKNDGGF